MANDRLDYRTEKNKMSKDEANLYAKKIIIDDKISQQSDVNSLPYPKSSTNDIYTNYAPLEGSSVASEMTIQHHDKPFPMMPAPSQQSTNSVSSFNGYDSTDNYSSY